MSVLYFSDPKKISGVGIAITIALHAAVLWCVVRWSVTAAPPPPVLKVTLLPIVPPKPLLPVVVPPPPAKPVVLPKPRSKPKVSPVLPPNPVLASERPVPLAREVSVPPPIIEPAPPQPSAPVVSEVPSQPVVKSAPVSVTAPRFDADYLSNPKPEYPPMSKRRGEAGTVILRVFVKPDGLPGKVLLDQSSGYERLDRAALEAVRNWKFVPARQGTETVADWVKVPLSFALRG